MSISGLNLGYADYVTSTVTDSSSAVKDKLSVGLDASDEELMEACKGFEAYFLEQIFNTMLESTKVFSDEEENTYASKMVDYFKDTAVQTLTEQASDQNGIGIAKTLYEQMKRQYSSIDPEALKA